MLSKEVEANGQDIHVALFRAYNIVVHAKVVLVMRKPDVKKAYPRVQLVGQIQLLSLSESE
ncbi:MAG: hypothetical protein DLM61_09425 [Pseudonocardiales bacterium]|nr:MAG: hypothetical protein DLM61_09425 [Pseudonocardiales bacterium]